MKEEYLWVDVVRSIAIFAVVMLHCAAPTLYNLGSIPDSQWWMGNIYNSMCRFSVPVFFLISGVLLIGKQEPVGVFLSKRWKKVGVPLIVWSLFFLLSDAFWLKKGDVGVKTLLSILYTPAYFHLWFLYALISIYLFIPVMRSIAKNGAEKIQWYFVLLWFVSVAVIQFSERISQVDIKIDLYMVGGFVGYFMLGHVLKDVRSSKRLFLLCSFCFLVCVAVTSYGTYRVTIANGGRFVNTFYSYTGPNVIFMTVTFLLMVKFCVETFSIFNSRFFRNMIGLVSSASFGVYFIHPMFIHLLRRGSFGFSLNPLVHAAAYCIPLSAVLVFAASLFVVTALKKVPFVNYAVP